MTYKHILARYANKAVMCVDTPLAVCVCVCVGEGERGREREGERGGVNV